MDNIKETGYTWKNIDRIGDDKFEARLRQSHQRKGSPVQARRRGNRECKDTERRVA